MNARRQIPGLIASLYTLICVLAVGLRFAR
jgi:hypothetical protein